MYLHIHEKNTNKYRIKSRWQTYGNLFVNKQGEATENE